MAERSQARARASGQRGFFGVLLREPERGGVGCIHPWPELGDATLEEELAALAGGQPLRLGEQALQCAAVDGRAREKGVSLLGEIAIPPSHYFWSAGSEAGRQGEEVAAGGYPAVKVKLGGDVKAGFDRVAEVAAAVEVPLRLDFNAALAGPDALGFFRSLGEDLRERIELVEDPCPYDPVVWDSLSGETGIDLAIDWGFRPDRPRLPTGAALGVFKPARDDGRMLLDRELPVLVTGYMDHPIGQMWAAWWAARIAGGDLTGVVYHGCGLLTHGHFSGDPALELVRQDGACLLPPEGTGLGFDGYLEELDWEDLR